MANHNANEIKVEPHQSNLVNIAMKLHTVTHPTDPKGEAGSKKAPMWLLPPFALEEAAWVHGLGSAKYGPWNWVKTKVCASTYISAIMRHLMAWHQKQDNDPESGRSHLAHIVACCNILMDAQHKKCLDDDRV